MITNHSQLSYVQSSSSESSPYSYGESPGLCNYSQLPFLATSAVTANFTFPYKHSSNQVPIVRPMARAYSHTLKADNFASYFTEIIHVFRQKISQHAIPPYLLFEAICIFTAILPVLVEKMSTSFLYKANLSTWVPGVNPSGPWPQHFPLFHNSMYIYLFSSTKSMYM